MALPTTNLIAQYVAGTGVTSSGGLVSSWANQRDSGNNPLTQATSANKPTDGTDWKGRPVVILPFINAPVAGNTAFMTAAALAVDSRAATIWIVKSGFGGRDGDIFSFNDFLLAGWIRRISDALKSSSLTNTGTTQYDGIHPTYIGAVCGASDVKIYSPRGNNATTAALRHVEGTPAGTHTGFTIGRDGNSNTAFYFMNVYEILVYSKTQDSTEIANTRAYLEAAYPFIVKTPTCRTIIEGDSIFEGILATANHNFPAQLFASNRHEVFNLSLSGSTTTQATARQARVNALYDSGVTRNVINVGLGRNDMVASNGNKTAATFYTDYTTLINNYTSTFEIHGATCIANTDSATQTRIDTWNATMRTNFLTDCTHATKIIDYGADAKFNAIGDASNGTYYADGTHLTNAGHDALAAVYAAADSLAAQATFTFTSGPSTGTVGSVGNTSFILAITGAPSDGTGTVTVTSDNASDQIIEYDSNGFAVENEHTGTLNFTVSDAGTVYFRVNWAAGSSHTLTFTNNFGATNPSPVVVTVSAAGGGSGNRLSMGMGISL